MKKRLLQLIFLTLCLTLSACGSRNWISGEVIEATPTALILESEDGQRTADSGSAGGRHLCLRHGGTGR